MKKNMIVFALCLMCSSFISCGTQNESGDVPAAEATTLSENEPESEPTEPAQSNSAETTQAAQAETETTQAAETAQSEETQAEQNADQSEYITEDQALDAIKNYCFINNPNLKDMVDSGEYTIYWNVYTNDANEIVVLYRSYTGAQNRYYISPASGDTYVTEYVPGIIDQEQHTEESFNIKDYLV